MKKLTTVLFTLVCVACLGVTLAGCGGGSVSVTTELELAKASRPNSVQYEGSETLSGMTKIKSSNVNLTCDLTLNTSGEYLAAYADTGRVFGNMTFEGNNHTITITGESSGKLGKFMSLFIRRADNCTFNNLNIVYDLPVKLSTKNGGADYVGGLVGWSNSCVFNNCTVTFNDTADIDFYTDSHGFHDYSFGGIAGYANSSTFTNCRTVMKCDYVSRDFGGIVGRANGCTITKCNSDVSLTTNSLEDSYIGGLAGYVENSTLSESWVTVNQFEINGKPQGWRNETSYSGLLVGTINGNSQISNGYADLNGSYSVDSTNNGLFQTTMKTGLIAASASDKTAVKNVYVDTRNGYYDFVAIQREAENPADNVNLLTTQNFIYSNAPSNAENIFCIGKRTIFSIFETEIYDTSYNLCPQYKYVFSYDEVVFNSSTADNASVWTTDKDGKPIIKE